MQARRASLLSGLPKCQICSEVTFRNCPHSLCRVHCNQRGEHCPLHTTSTPTNPFVIVPVATARSPALSSSQTSQGAAGDGAESFSATEQWWAAQSGDMDTLKRCVEAGIDLDAKDALGNTLLYYAATSDHAAVVDFLLDHGARDDAASQKCLRALKPGANERIRRALAEHYQAQFEYSNISERARAQSMPPTVPVPAAAAAAPSLSADDVQALLDLQQCKVCMEAVSDTVFVPCGHLGFCAACISSVSECPICRVKIEQKIKVFRV